MKRRVNITLVELMLALSSVTSLVAFKKILTRVCFRKLGMYMYVKMTLVSKLIWQKTRLLVALFFYPSRVYRTKRSFLLLSSGDNISLWFIIITDGPTTI